MLINIREAATRLGMTEPQVRGWVQRGTVPSVRVGQRLFIDEDQLAAFMSAQVRGPKFETNRKGPKFDSALGFWGTIDMELPSSF